MKSRNHSVKYNFIMNCILTASSFIFPLLTFPYVSRVLTPVYLGKVTYATSIVAYFSMISSLGIPTYGIRLCAGLKNDKEKLSKSVIEILIINAITCVCSYILLFLIVFFIPEFSEYKSVIFIISLTILFNAIGMEWLYRGLEQYEYITKRSIFFKIIAIIGLFFFVHSKKDYIMYAALTILASVGSNVLNFYNAKEFIDFKISKEFKFKQHIKPIMIFFAMSIATQIYTNMDSVMLGWMKGDAEVSYYSAAVKVKCVLFSVVTSLSSVLLPRASQYIQEGRKNEFEKISIKSIRFVILISVLMCIYFCVFAKESIHILCGDEYMNAVLPMQIIMPTVCIIGLSNVSGIQMLIPLGLEKGVLVSEILGSVVDLMINYILIPTMGAIGAAIGTLIAEIVVLFVQFLYLKDYRRVFWKKIEWWKYILSALLFLLVLLVVNYSLNYNYIISMIVAGVCGTLVYIFSILILKEKIGVEIWNIIFSFFKR